ncbi:MAG: hypothetical protein ACI9T9_001349 [Oleiphilaceae bacterium]|jgi:hypothetical protein
MLKLEKVKYTPFLSYLAWLYIDMVEPGDSNSPSPTKIILTTFLN